MRYPRIGAGVCCSQRCVGERTFRRACVNHRRRPMTEPSHSRRSWIIGAGLAGAALASTSVRAAAQVERKTFVLVHGSSAGGWCYRRVADLLERRGHKVFAPTLTGLGERSHLMSGMITLDTHIT